MAGGIAGYVGGAYLFGDGQTYDRPAWTLIRISELVTSGVFDSTTGARTAERRQISRYETTAVAEDAGVIRHLYGDGSTALESKAPWRVGEDVTDQMRLDRSGRLKQVDSRLKRVAARRNYSGPYTIRGEKTDETTAHLRQVDRVTKIYEERGEDGLAIVTITKGTTLVELQSGRSPVPTYKRSRWTDLILDALTVTHEDATLLEWFGPSKALDEHRWAQSLAELERILRHRRAREVSFKVSVTRPETLVRIGDTVEIVDWEHRLHDRLLVTQVAISRDPLTGAANVTCDLELPL